MKKTIIYAMLSALLVTGAAMGVSAAETQSAVVYTPSAMTVAPGGTFDVTVSFNGIENALGYAVMLGDDGLDIEKVTLSESGPEEVAEAKASLFAADPNDANDVAAAYLSETTLNGDYVKYTFTVSDSGANGTITLAFTTKVLDKNNAEISGAADATVEVTIGTVSGDKLVIGRDSGYTLDEETGYLEGVTEQTTVESLISNFDNEEGTVRVVDADGNEITDTSAYVGTGSKVQIKVGNTWTDAATVIVKGDVNGDGKVSALDLLQYYKHKSDPINNPLKYEKAFDFNDDDKITAIDLLNYYKYKSNS